MSETKLINGYPFIKHTPIECSEEERIAQSHKFLELMMQRRSVRFFRDKPVPKEAIENVIAVANSAPSGANKQPWTFCIIQNPELKKQIRKAAEDEERKSYNGRMPAEWLADLAPLQTTWEKAFLEIAPWLIIVFKKSYEIIPGDGKRNNYYASESTGIATGFLIAAIHAAGLVTLTHTPSPMNFLAKILDRPENEKAFLLLPVGYPADECWVPELHKKTLKEVSVFY